jgi:hypothetical protein
MKIGTSAASSIAEGVVESVASNLEPGDVFEEKVILEYVRANFSPDGVFADNELALWATENGYKLGE